MKTGAKELFSETSVRESAESEIMSKNLFKTERLSMPLMLEKPIVERIDVWAEKLSMTRAGMLRLLIRTGGPIIETMVDLMTEQLKEACRQVRENPLFFHLHQVCHIPAGHGITLDDARRRAEALDALNDGNPAEGNHTNHATDRAGKAKVPRRGEKIAAQANAKSQTRGRAGSEARSGYSGSRTGKTNPRRNKIQ